MKKVIRLVARAPGKQGKFNTLDIREDWEIVDIGVAAPVEDPVLYVDDGASEDDDDWEIVDIGIITESDESQR